MIVTKYSKRTPGTGVRSTRIAFILVVAKVRLSECRVKENFLNYAERKHFRHKSKCRLSCCHDFLGTSMQGHPSLLFLDMHNIE